jgi:uncharacterized protein DUF4184
MLVHGAPRADRGSRQRKVLSDEDFAGWVDRTTPPALPVAPTLTARIYHGRMPYAFAHPAAVIPLARMLGSRAVPSALAIGSMIPDAWYFVPSLARADTHDALGWLWFCLPAGLLAYLGFHLIFKQPMLALAPKSLAGRLAPWTSPGLPHARWSAVLLSLAAGIATHIVWDAFTHGGPVARLLQHASTLAGTAFLAAWLWRKLCSTVPQTDVRELHPRVRTVVLVAMAIVPAIAFVSVLSAFDAGAWRTALRAAGVTAFSALGLVALSFCLTWQRWLRA